jgi:hypothetical protein
MANNILDPQNSSTLPVGESAGGGNAELNSSGVSRGIIDQINSLEPDRTKEIEKNAAEKAEEAAHDQELREQKIAYAKAGAVAAATELQLIQAARAAQANAALQAQAVERAQFSAIENLQSPVIENHGEAENVGQEQEIIQEPQEIEEHVLADYTEKRDDQVSTQVENEQGQQRQQQDQLDEVSTAKPAPYQERKSGPVGAVEQTNSAQTKQVGGIAPSELGSADTASALGGTMTGDAIAAKTRKAQIESGKGSSAGGRASAPGTPSAAKSTPKPPVQGGASAAGAKGGKLDAIGAAGGAVAAKLAESDDPRAQKAAAKIQTATTVAADAADLALIATIAAGDVPGFLKGLYGISTRHPVIGYSILAILLAPLLSFMVWIILFVVFLNANPGNTPSGDTTVASSVSSSNWANPNGEYPSEMTPTLGIGRGKTLTLDATSGGYSCEDEAYIDGSGAARLRTTNETLSISSGPSAARDFSGKRLTQQEIDYYLTARFPYVLAKWSGSTAANPNKSAGAKDYWGRKIVIYSPVTKKGVVGIAAEYGPAAWTGIAKNKNDISSNSKVQQQYSSWQQGSINGARSQVPSGYLGRIAGGGNAISRGLGFPGKSIDNCDKPIVIGFLKDQDAYPLGHVFTSPGTTTVPGAVLVPNPTAVVSKPKPQE